MKKLFLFLVLSTTTFVAVHAQMPKDEAEDSPNYIKAFEALQVDNDIDLAITFFEKEIETNPTNGYAALMLGRVYLLNSNYIGCINSLSKAEKALPKKDKESFMGCYIAKGLAYQMMEDNANALKYYEKAKKVNPTASDPYLIISDFHKEQGDSVKAAKTLEEALKVDPKNADIHEMLAKEAAESERHKEAIEHYNKAIEANSTNYDLYLQRAVEHLQTENAGQGSDDLLDAFKFWIYSGMKNGEKIENILNFFIEYEHKTLLEKVRERIVDVDEDEDEDESFIWQTLEGIIYQNIPDKKAALAYFQNRYEKEGGDVASQLAQVYYDNGLYKKALEIIETHKNSTDSIDFGNTEINIYQQLGEKDKALAAVEEKYSDDQDNPYPHLVRAAVEYKDGNLEAAFSAVDKLCEFNDLKNDARILLLRGYILSGLGRQEEANECFNNIIDSEEDEVEVRDKLIAYASLGNDEKVEEIITELEAEDNNDLLAIAQARAIQKQYDKALIYLQLLKDNGMTHYNAIDSDPIFRHMKSMKEYQDLMSDWKKMIGE